MKVSVVFPVWNEEEVLPELKRRLDEALAQLPPDVKTQIIFVDDGSADRTPDILEEFCRSDPRVIRVRLSRNFGQQASIMAGLAQATGDYVVLLDGDLEDPPDLIPRFYTKGKSGFDIILGVRIDREDKWWRKLLFSWFHRALRVVSDFPIHMNTGTACLLSRRAVRWILELGERNRFLPGLRSWVGFPVATVEYNRSGRFAGSPKQDLSRLFRYAMDAIFSFSYKPLRLSLYLGCATWSMSMLYAFILVIQRLLNIDVVRGFTTTVVLVLFFGGTILVSIGILGEYLGRIYDEVKRRPLYIVDLVTKGQMIPESDALDSEQT